MLRIFDIIIGVLLLIATFLILFIPNKILSELDQIQSIIGALCFITSGLLVRLIKLEDKIKELSNEK